MSEVHSTVQKIFKRLVGDRAAVLEGSHYPSAVNERISAVLHNDGLESNINDPIDLSAIGFHLVDWNSDAAFLVALQLFPEEFTDEEIRQGIEAFLIHAPAHCQEAARLGGYSVENPFTDELANEQT